MGQGVRVEGSVKWIECRPLTQILYGIAYCNISKTQNGFAFFFFLIFLRGGWYQRYAKNFSLLIDQGLGKHKVVIMSRKETIGNALTPEGLHNS